MTTNAKDITVSLDTRVLKAIDAHCTKTGLKRSTFLQRAALTAMGAFSYEGTPILHDPAFESLDKNTNIRQTKPEKPAIGRAAKVLQMRPKKR
jgi:hypothetical protein